ncbi:MAG: hypothetical protein WBB82_02995 [Limnothrix sp.]
MAVLLYHHSLLVNHQMGMAFFATGKSPLFGTREDALTALAQVVAIALLGIGLSKKFWPSQTSQKQWFLQKFKKHRLLLVCLLIPLSLLASFYSVGGIIAFCLLLCSLGSNKLVCLGILFLIPLHISLLYGHGQVLAIAERNSFNTGIQEVIKAEVHTEIQQWMSTQTCDQLANEEWRLLKVSDFPSDSKWAIDLDSLPSEIVYLGKQAIGVAFYCDVSGDFSTLRFLYPDFGDDWTMSFVFPPEKSSQAASSRAFFSSESEELGFYFGDGWE